MKRLIYCMAILIVVCGCEDKPSSGSASFEVSSCRGIFFDRNKYGALRKWNEFPNSQKTACLLENESLSAWEQSVEDRRGHGVACSPQVLDVSLVAGGNYYEYRDGREYLDLNGTTGEYRRVFLGELKDGRQAFSREEGCFWVRDGTGVDAAFGRQILLDTTSIAATEPFVPAEIYRVDQSGSKFLFSRFDDKASWGYTFCPDLRTPWSYCTELRNGNIMYYPDLTTAIQTSLTNEAVLIRTAFNFSSMDRSGFESLWNGLLGSRTESASSNWKYAVSHVVDTPRFTDGAWREYVMGSRPTMPDVGSSNQPPTCYDARKSVTLSDGSPAFVNGQVCYENGVFSFIQE